MRRIAWVIVPLVLLVLLGVAVFAARAPQATTAFTLQPGQCFDIPADDQIGEIATIDCAQPHDAEVFVAGSPVDPSPTGPVPYPGADGVAAWAGAQCGQSAQDAYLGAGAAHPILVVGYFFPDAAAWDHGERQVTCYLHASDGSKLTTPLRAPGTSAGPS